MNRLTIPVQPFQHYKGYTIASILLIWIMVGVPLHGVAGEILNDTLSPRKQYGDQFNWAHPGDRANLSREAFFLLRSKVSGVEVRLGTAGYEGRRARIYLRLPQQIIGYNSTEGFLLSWNTDRIFSPGSVRPGSRALLFDGIIEMALLVEVFTFTLEVDATFFDGMIKYAPIFEIETY